MKKMLTVLLIMILAISMLPVYANNYPVPNLNPDPSLNASPQVAILNFNGVNQTLATPTLWENGKTFLPTRGVVEALGLHIHYVEATRSIYIVDNANFAHTATADKAEEGSFNLFRNNEKKNVTFKIANDSSYVAAAELAAALGLYYYEDVRTNTVYYFDNSAEMKDGVYSAVALESRGWAPQADITVENGKIVAVTYNEYHNEDGRGKKTDDTYKSNWKSRYENAPDLADVIDQLEAELLVKQNPAAVDSITGATSASSSFKAVVGKAMAKAKAEKANDTRIVDLGGELVDAKYRDGKYVVVGLTDSRGWTPQLDMVVEDGKIVSAIYNSFNAAGEGKREDGAGYLTSWTSRYEGVDPVAIIAEREAQLIKTQDANLVDVATSATGWGHDLKRFAAGALYHAKRADVEVTADSTIYIFVGDSTANSAYYSQLLAIAEGKKVQAIDYVEFQRGNPLAKPHNPSYVGENGRWWQNYNETTLAGRKPLAVRQEMTEFAMKNKGVDGIDTISGASNWRKGYVQLVPRAFQIIEN